MPTPKTILIIDDDDDLREALAEQLALHEAFRPVQAATATEGVRMGREVRADLILMDVDLPDMEGREATRRLRAQTGPTQFAPVIAITASATERDWEACRAAGMTGHVAKPIEPAALYAALDEALSSVEARAAA